MQHFADFTFFQVSLIKIGLTLTSVVDRQRFDADTDPKFHIVTDPDPDPVPNDPNAVMENWKKKNLFFTAMPVYNVFPFLINGLGFII